MENKIKLLVADDILNERKKITAWVNSCLPAKSFTVTEFEKWKDAESEISKQKKNSYDFVLTDIVFERQDDGRTGGKSIAEAAMSVTRKTRIFLISKNWGKHEILQITSKLPSVKTISKDDETTQIDFNLLFYSELDKWCEYKCLQMSFDQKEILKASIAKGKATGDSEFEIGNEKWKLKNLFPHIDWLKGDSTKNFQKVITYIIKYPQVKSKSWFELPANTTNCPYKLPIRDYYEELYYNPKYFEELNKIKLNTVDFLRFNFKYFVYNTLGDTINKTAAKRELLNHRHLTLNYTEKLDGENAMGEIEFATMKTFCRNLTGRLIAIGLYLFLEFSTLEIYDLLNDGKYEKKRNFKDKEPQPDILLSQFYFITGTSTRAGHARYKRYNDIFKSCSEDEKNILKEWWSEMNTWLTKHSNLTEDNLKTVNDRINDYIHYIPLD